MPLGLLCHYQVTNDLVSGCCIKMECVFKAAGNRLCKHQSRLRRFGPSGVKTHMHTLCSNTWHLSQYSFSGVGQCKCIFQSTFLTTNNPNPSGHFLDQWLVTNNLMWINQTQNALCIPGEGEHAGRDNSSDLLFLSHVNRDVKGTLLSVI